MALIDVNIFAILTILVPTCAKFFAVQNGTKIIQIAEVLIPGRTYNYSYLLYGLILHIE